ncbi:MAG: PHP domain-containing protein, partial [Solobacterium sp.]|nr:PHP domain-containing protein [Solobacterium sp.]
MGMLLEKLFEKQAAPGLEHLGSVEVERVRFYRTGRRIACDLKHTHVLSFSDYVALRDWMSMSCGCPVDLSVQAADASIAMNELEKYLFFLYEQDPELSILKDSTLIYDADQKLVRFQFETQRQKEQGEAFSIELKDYFSRIGLPDLHALFELHEEQIPEIETVIRKKEPEPVKVEEPKKKPRYKSAKRENWPLVQLKDVADQVDDIKITADVFADETIITKLGKKIKTFSVYDGTDAIQVKAFEGRNFTPEELDGLKKGKRYSIYGSVVFDTYAKDLVMTAVQMDEEDVPKTVDPAAEKRVELHCHTNMSEMDAVCKAEEVVTYAWNLGHEGICITDHADVQGFVKAFNTAQSLKKGDKER